MNQESHTDSPERESKSGSPAYPAGLLGPDCGCPVYYAVTRCQHGGYACNLCNVEHTANCPKMQVAPVQTLGDPSDPDGWLGPLPSDDGPGRDQHGTHERGAQYVVDPREMVGLPAPDFGASAPSEAVDLNARYADASTCECGALIEEIDQGDGVSYWAHVKRMRIPYDHPAVPARPEVTTFDDVLLAAAAEREPGLGDAELETRIREIIHQREQGPTSILSRRFAARQIIALVREHDRRASHEGATVSAVDVAAVVAERFQGGER